LKRLRENWCSSFPGHNGIVTEGGLVCYLFLSGKEKTDIAKELKTALGLGDNQAVKIVRQMSGRVETCESWPKVTVALQTCSWRGKVSLIRNSRCLSVTQNPSCPLLVRPLLCAGATVGLAC